MQDDRKMELMKNAESMLNQNLVVMNDLIAQNWLASLSTSDVVACENGTSEALIELYSVEKLVYDAEEGIVDKLVSLYSAMNSCEATVFLMIRSDGIRTRLYIGCRHGQKPDVAGSLLRKSLSGNFPGISLKKVKDKNAVLDECIPLEYDRQTIASLAVRPNFRREHGEDDKNTYVQGLEKFMEGMAGEEYTAIILAEPETREDIRAKQESYERMMTGLTKYHKFTLTYSENESRAMTSGLSSSMSKTVSDSLGNAVSKATTRSVGHSLGFNHSNSAGLGLLFASFGSSDGFSSGRSSGRAKTKSSSVTTTRTTATGDTQTTTESETDTLGTTNSITLNIEDKHITTMLQRLEEMLTLLLQSEAFGLWKTAAYFLSRKSNTAVVAANNFKSFVIGDQAGTNESFMNVWDNTAATYHNSFNFCFRKNKIFIRCNKYLLFYEI